MNDQQWRPQWPPQQSPQPQTWYPPNLENPPSQHGNMPPQQQFQYPPSPSLPYQQQSMYQLPTLPRPKRKRYLWTGVIIAIVVLFAGIGTVLASAGKNTPTHISHSADPALLGADISAFIARYGKPNSDSSNGTYNFHLFSNPNNDDLSISTHGTRVTAILEIAPNAQGWSISNAEAICLAFAPPDAVYQRNMTLLDGQGNAMASQRVYYSASLSKQFPSSEFTDENGNPDRPGTFSMVLNYNLGSPSHIAACAIQIALQQK